MTMHHGASRLPAATVVLEEVVVTDAAQYTIDDLSAASRVPSRTIRFYQQKGVLPAPVIKGRVAYYGDKHKERLELIAQLQDRGLRIDAIRELLGRIDKGELDVGEWLGLEAQLKAPWAEDAPRTMSEDEIASLFSVPGTPGTDGARGRPGVIADLVRTKTITRQGSAFQVRSPALLAFAARLEQTGVDLEVAIAAHAILRRHLGKAARELVDHFFAKASDVDARELIAELRPLGLEAVRVVFAQEMEHVLREALESGRGARLTTKKGKRRSA